MIIIITGITLNAPPSESDYSQLEVCYYGGKTLFLENAPHRELFNKSTLNDVEGKIFKMNDILLVKTIGNNACDLVIEDDRGRRSYRLELEKNSKFEHFYRIANIKGQKLISPYQWEDKL